MSDANVSASAFDAGYYESAERGGFCNYVYGDPAQQEQLRFKWADVAIPQIPYDTVLFVGCAKGFEVRFFRERGKHAYGCDISRYAISNVSPIIQDFCRLTNGSELDYSDDAFHATCAFDVMTLASQKEALAAEIARVTERFIVIRVTILPWRLDGREFHGVDGVPFRLERLAFWDRAFTLGGKFRLLSARIHCTDLERYEAHLWFVRQEAMRGELQ